MLPSGKILRMTTVAIPLNDAVSKQDLGNGASRVDPFPLSIYINPGSKNRALTSISLTRYCPLSTFPALRSLECLRLLIISFAQTNSTPPIQL